MLKERREGLMRGNEGFCRRSIFSRKVWRRGHPHVKGVRSEEWPSGA